MSNTIDCKECNGMPPLPSELAIPEAQMATACLLMTAVMKTMDAENKELREQNAKLRELLLDVWNDAMQFDGFWDYVNDDGEIYNEDELPHYYDRMRELGVEVP